MQLSLAASPAQKGASHNHTAGEPTNPSPSLPPNLQGGNPGPSQLREQDFAKDLMSLRWEIRASQPFPSEGSGLQGLGLRARASCDYGYQLARQGLGSACSVWVRSNHMNCSHFLLLGTCLISNVGLMLTWKPKPESLWHGYKCLFSVKIKNSWAV